jgi:hypothetical protein
LVFLPSGVGSAVSGLIELRIRCATGTRATISFSTSADGSARCIQKVTSPADWTRELTAEAVAVVCQWHGGDWCSIDPIHVKSRGQILAPSTRAGRISILRVFSANSLPDMVGMNISAQFARGLNFRQDDISGLIGSSVRALAIWRQLRLSPADGRTSAYSVRKA